MVIVKGNAQKYETEIVGKIAKIYADVPMENGVGSDNMRPMELVLGGVGACLNITLRMILDKNSIAYNAVNIELEESRTGKEGTMCIFVKIDIEADISVEDKEKYIQKAIEKAPVFNAILGNVEFKRK